MGKLPCSKQRSSLRPFRQIAQFFARHGTATGEGGHCIEGAIRLLDRAHRCRWLAAEIANRNDPAVSKLLGLAEELEQEAAKHIEDKHRGRR
jgi:hypothetical protein